MSEGNQIIHDSAPEEFPLKRKRGHPLRDENLSQGIDTVATAEWDGLRTNEFSEEDLNCDVEDELLGQVVSGVLGCSFDAGYFVTMKAQNSNATLTGLVFYPGKFVPITPENDVAPQAKMYQRNELDFPNVSPLNQIDGSAPHLPSSNQTFQFESQTPNATAQITADQLQRVPARESKGQPLALASYMGSSSENDTPNSKVLSSSQQVFDFGVDNYFTPVVEQLNDYRIVDQDEIMKEFEASACMNAPSSALDSSDFRLDSISELRNVYPENSINSQGPDSKKLVISCAQELTGAESSFITINQDEPLDVNKRPSDDRTVESKADSEYDRPKSPELKMTLFHSGESLPSDLKLGFEKDKCPTPTSPEPSHPASSSLPTRTDDKKNADDPPSPFFINLTGRPNDTQPTSQHSVPESLELKILDKENSSDGNDKPVTESVNFKGADAQVNLNIKDSTSTMDHSTLEVVSSELNLLGKVTPQASNLSRDALIKSSAKDPK